VGVVLDELDRLNLTSSTIVAFLGDHGWQLGDLGEFGKKTNFERATRAPLIIKMPGGDAASGLLLPPAGLAAPAGPAPTAVFSHALVEFVDIMPTLIDLAGLRAAATCPADSTHVRFCTEGSSLKPMMVDPTGTADARPAAFMQYAYCMHDEGVWHDACNGPADPMVMGYAIRTRRWRYIEWVRFDKSTVPPTIKWEQLLGTELYDHTAADTVANVAESVNVVAEPQLAAVVKQLSAQLHAGWRHANTHTISGEADARSA
jgi:iduronate 2-sulfatase